MSAVEQIAEKILRVSKDADTKVVIGWDRDTGESIFISFRELRALAEAARTK